MKGRGPDFQHRGHRGRGVVIDPDGISPDCLRDLCVKKRGSGSGFALVITIVLLALLVLVVYALSALGRVGADVSATGVYQAQARQHALLGLSQALGDLQRYAGEDDMLTGMAGVTGIPAGSGQPARHWCGVWDRDGDFFHWLASGMDESLIPNLANGDSISLVAGGSVGNFDTEDREYVRVLLQAVVVNSRDRASVRLGSYAWWVGDEGVKLSMAFPGDAPPVADGRHELAGLLSPSAVPPDTQLDDLLSYEQLDIAGVSANNRKKNMHVLGKTHSGYSGSVLLEGRLNINTNSRRFWQGVAETYNGLRPGGAPSISSPPVFGQSLSDDFFDADPGAGKEEGGPYPSVDLFLNSTALTEALTASGGSLIAFGDVMRPWLAVRSDTFRVRAYGDAVNPADSARIEAAAWCEAIVQRTKDDPASSEGRFSVIYFRWLGPEDI